VIKLLKDYVCQIELQQGCRRVVYTDAFQNFQKLTDRLKSGVCVADNNVNKTARHEPIRCKVCQKSLHSDNDTLQQQQQQSTTDGYLIVWCKHCLHSKCAQGKRHEKIRDDRTIVSMVHCCKVAHQFGGSSVK